MLIGWLGSICSVRTAPSLHGRSPATLTTRRAEGRRPGSATSMALRRGWVAQPPKMSASSSNAGFGVIDINPMQPQEPILYTSRLRTPSALVSMKFRRGSTSSPISVVNIWSDGDARLDLYPQETAHLGIHGGFPQLGRVHFAQALVALDALPRLTSARNQSIASRKLCTGASFSPRLARAPRPMRSRSRSPTLTSWL